LFADALGGEDDAPASSDEHPLLTHMGFAPVSLDALQARCELDTATLQAQLLTLELDGSVGRLPGGLFQRLSPS
jgi:DNA processing protein